jgi:hypothetical protein
MVPFLTKSHDPRRGGDPDRGTLAPFLGSSVPSRQRTVILGVVVLFGAAARALPLLAPNGPQATASFDESIYLSAAGLFSEGWMPYRDFGFLHPPGILLLLWPLTTLAPEVLGWNDALVLGRWAGVALGTANLVLVAVLATRWRGWVSGVVAATLYATYAPAITIERHILLEPAVNAVVLCAAMLWLASSGRVSSGHAAAAGALVGLAATIKLTGGLAIAGILLADRLRSEWRQRVLAIGAAVAVFALIVVPFLVASGPGDFARLVVGAQVERPGGDVIGGSLVGVRSRLRHLIHFGLLNVASVPGVVRVMVLLALIAAVVWSWARGGRHGRFWAALFVAIGPTLLLAPDYYDQYPVSLAPTMAIIGGAGAVATLEHLHRHGAAVLRVAVVALAVLLVGGMAVVGRAQWSGLPRGAPDVGAQFRAQVDPEDCVSSDAPYLVLAAGMLPPSDATGAPLADPFGELLAIALERTSAWPSTSAALLDVSAQERLRAGLAACRYVALTSRPEHHIRFSASTSRWFVERYRLILDGGHRPTLWVQRDPAP